jgi:2-polyprenyl-3-methyl-5-hydroxy-6-metoxy-1,4-benzoquinol methylase
MAEHVCPVWVGYLLTNPLRKLFQNPTKILGPYISEGMKVLDIGCAMGFFSLPLARMVGSGGKVICVDLQAKMIETLEKRAKKAGMSDIIKARVCPDDSLGLADLNEKIDFAVAFAVVHEVPDRVSFFSEVHATLKPGGRLFVAEPHGHVSENDFETTVSIGKRVGFRMIQRPEIRRSRAVLLGK